MRLIIAYYEEMERHFGAWKHQHHWPEPIRDGSEISIVIVCHIV